LALTEGAKDTVSILPVKPRERAAEHAEALPLANQKQSPGLQPQVLEARLDRTSS